MNLSNFPESRYHHCYNVGLKMYDYAKNVLHWDEKKSLEMFVLGNIHDIGYAFEDNSHSHDELIYNALKNSYKYANEILYHSTLQQDYMTEEMKLLYFADATVDKDGVWCSYEDRLKDLLTRHGKNSESYKAGVDIVAFLKQCGYDDSIQLTK